MLSPQVFSASRRRGRAHLGRLLTLLIAAIVAVGGLVAIPAPALAVTPPANDDFVNAQVLTGTSATASGSNVGATTEVNEPNHYGYGGASVWFSWTAPADGVAVADPAGSGFDTIMSVYTGTSVDRLERITAVDDSDGTVQGLVEFPVIAGTTYAIAVDGYGGESGPVEFRLTFSGSSTGSISGHIVDSQIQADRYGVCVDAYSSEDESAGKATSDGYGQYRIAGLEAGTYRLGFSDCASGTFLEFYDDAPTYELATPVTVVASTPTTGIDAEIVVPDVGFVSGQVTDTDGNPLANICVDLSLVDGNNNWQVRTDSDGRYQAEVESGRLQAHFMPCDLGYPIEEWYDGATQETADIFTVAPGQTTTGIDASMVIGGQVVGTVKDDAGTVLPLVCVDLLDENGARVDQPYATVSNGSYRFRNVVPGTYFVGFRNCRDIGPFADEFYEDAETFAEATPVVVTAAGTAVANGVLERIAAPDTVILTGPAEGSTIASTTATFTFASDPAEAARSFICQIDSRNWSVCTNPRTFTGLSQGSHTFRVYAVGVGGVEDPTEAERTFRVDTSPPNTFLDSGPAAGSTIKTREATFVFRGAAGDTAKLQCQLDTAAWEDCTSPLTLTDLADGQHTVRFRAQDAVGNQDQTPASRSFTVDTEAPDTTIDSGPDGLIATDKATFTFHGTEGDTAKTQCHLDDTEWADCTSPLSLSDLDEGNHTVAFRAEDAAGNQDQTPATRGFTVDTKNPDTTIDSGPTGLIATDKATFTFHGTEGDTAKIQCRLDDTEWADCTSPLSLSDLDEGNHTVAFRAEDAAGNQDQTPATRGVTVDTKNPDTTIDSGPTGLIATDKATFTFHGTEDDTAKIQCRLDDAEWADCTSPLSLTDLDEGNHTVAFRAEDAAGNQDQTPASRSFTVDLVAPDTTIDSGPTGLIATDKATFTFHGTEGDTAKIQCRLDDAEWADCTSPTIFNDLDEGDHTVAFRAEDAGGNQDQTPAARKFTIDTVAPNTTIDSGPDDRLASDEATFTFHGTEGDTAKIQCRVDDAEWADCTSPTSFADLTEGQHMAAFRAEDAVGNQDRTPAERLFTVDTVAPDTTIDSGPDGAIATDKATFTFHGAEDDTEKIQCRLDDAEWANCTSPLSLTDLPEGDHIVRFRAQDAAGNQDQSPASRSFTVDLVTPDTTIDSGPDGLIATDKAAFTFHGTEGDTEKIQCRLDDAEWANCTSPSSFADLTEGPHTVAFRAQDAAGNQDQTPASRSFTVDTVAPDTTIDSGPDAGSTIATRSASFTFHGTAGDTDQLQCRIDGSAWADCTSPANLADLGDGAHGAEFRAVDAAGNADASPATRAFQVHVPVVVPPQQPQQAQQPKATTRITLSAPKKVRQGTKVKVSLRLSGVTNGTIVIRDGRKIVRTIKVKGKATVKLTLKKLGKHRLTASFAGTALAKPAKSAVRTVVVKRKR